MDVRPLNDKADGSDGYEVHTERSTVLLRMASPAIHLPRHRLLRLFAGHHGTAYSSSRRRARFRTISDQLGNRVRTNSESLIGVRIPKSKEDLSRGVAIGSGIYIDEHTHIEAVRYPAGSDAMGGLATILTGGHPGPGRVALWFKNVVVALRRSSVADAPLACSPSDSPASL